MSSGKRVATMVIGMIIMIGGFFGGFMMFFWMEARDIVTILLYMMLIPMVSFCIGAGIIVYGNKDAMPLGRSGFGLFGAMARMDESPKERSFIHEPPSFCKDCGASLSSEEIEWVGPLSVKCPYCGATHRTEKREI